uniref:peptidylprolyl isomerase n=1 Tax=Sus scrofa TaxID=9823 RepID=A0A8D1ZE98_PIG
GWVRNRKSRPDPASGDPGEELVPGAAEVGLRGGTPRSKPAWERGGGEVRGLTAATESRGKNGLFGGASVTPVVRSQVEPPEPCAEPAAFGDTLHIHYSGSLVDGRIFDTSLSRDPLVIELGQKQVIPGLEQSLLDMCVGEKRRVIIPSHLAYGKRGFPPSIPADAELHFDVELIALIRANYWQKLVKGILPLDVGDHMGSFNDVVSGWRFFVTWFGCRCGQGPG